MRNTLFADDPKPFHEMADEVDNLAEHLEPEDGEDGEDEDSEDDEPEE